MKLGFIWGVGAIFLSIFTVSSERMDEANRKKAQEEFECYQQMIEYQYKHGPTRRYKMGDVYDYPNESEEYCWEKLGLVE